MNELHWITRHYRGIILPKVIFDDDENYGCYYSPQPNVYYDIDGKDHDISKGLIVVSTKYFHLKKHVESTLAHEWRHHWQKMNGWELYAPEMSERNWENYDLVTTNYHQNSRCETDAYLFETKFAHGSDNLHYRTELFNGKNIVLPISSYL
jgi:hypothetical protein